METEKTSPAKPVIKEFVYEFKAKDRLPLELNKNSKIFLVINDHETSIAIENLFIGKIEFDDEDICGYSILQIITAGTQLKIDENTVLKITFIDKTTGREFYISKIRRSLFLYDDDMEISNESRLKYIDLLLNTSMIPIHAERQEREKLEALAAESERIRLEEDRKRIEQEDELRIERERKLITGGEGWEDQRNELIKLGLTEYSFEEYRLFYRPGEEDQPAEIGFFLLSPGNYEFIELYEEEITDEREEYSFEDDKEDEFRVVFDKVGNKLAVEKV